MPTTLTDVLTPKTEDQATADILARLDALGLYATSWHTDSIARRLVQAFGYVVARVTERAAVLARAAFNETAEGDALDAFSASRYRNNRIPSVATEGKIKLTCSAAAGPYTITAGELVVADAEEGLEFRALTGGTLKPGNTLEIVVRSEKPGTSGNVANGTITKLVSPALAGVTVNNPALPSTSSWITVLGADAESDASLRERNRSKWGTGAIEDSVGVLIYRVRTASPSIARLAVDDSNAAGPGAVAIYAAGIAGTCTGDAATAAQAALNARSFGDPYTVTPATAQPVAVTGTVYLEASADSAEVGPLVEAAITDAINAAPIGGYDLSPGPTHVLLKDSISRAIESVPGVRFAALAAPAGDVTIGAWSVATVGTLTLTYSNLTA
jgi:uncharacterized phage protein gp47/JayE